MFLKYVKIKYVRGLQQLNHIFKWLGIGFTIISLILPFYTFKTSGGYFSGLFYGCLRKNNNVSLPWICSVQYTVGLNSNLFQNI